MRIMKWLLQKHCALSSRDTVQQYSSKGTTGSRSGAPPSSRPARRRGGLRGCHTLNRVNTV